MRKRPAVFFCLQCCGYELKSTRTLNKNFSLAAGDPNRDRNTVSLKSKTVNIPQERQVEPLFVGATSFIYI